MKDRRTVPLVYPDGEGSINLDADDQSRKLTDFQRGKKDVEQHVDELIKTKNIELFTNDEGNVQKIEEKS